MSDQEYLCVLTQHPRIKEQRFPGFWFDNPMRDKSLLSEIKHQRGQVRSKCVRSLFRDQEIHESGEKVLFQDDTGLSS